MPGIGFDVTRSPECRVFEVHLTSDTSWMMRRYLQLTNDTDFLVKDDGYKAIADIANFWLSRAVLNPETSQYEIRGMPFICVQYTVIFTLKQNKIYLDQQFLSHIFNIKLCTMPAVAVFNSLSVIFFIRL